MKGTSWDKSSGEAIAQSDIRMDAITDEFLQMKQYYFDNIEEVAKHDESTTTIDHKEPPTSQPPLETKLNGTAKPRPPVRGKDDDYSSHWTVDRKTTDSAIGRRAGRGGGRRSYGNDTATYSNDTSRRSKISKSIFEEESTKSGNSSKTDKSIQTQMLLNRIKALEIDNINMAARFKSSEAKHSEQMNVSNIEHADPMNVDVTERKRKSIPSPCATTATNPTTTGDTTMDLSLFTTTSPTKTINTNESTSPASIATPNHSQTTWSTIVSNRQSSVGENQ
jgi:hypothetical protein